MKNNPYDNLVARLDAIESFLVKFDEKFKPNHEDRWDKGFEVASEELGVNTRKIMSYIGEIPHLEMLKAFYFNRRDLKAYLKNNEKRVKLF